MQLLDERILIHLKNMIYRVSYKSVHNSKTHENQIVPEWGLKNKICQSVRFCGKRKTIVHKFLGYKSILFDKSYAANCIPMHFVFCK